jgi:hypothetical protein
MSMPTGLGHLKRLQERIPTSVAISIAYLLCALWLCQSILGRGAGLILGGGEMPDWTGTAWAFWWTETALSQGSSPFTSSYNYFPSGQYPTAWYNLVDAILASPLIHFLGLSHGYNLFIILLLWTTGLGAHALSRSVGSSHQAALTSGLMWICCSWILTEIIIGRLSQAMMIFFLLGLAGLVRLAAGERSLRLSILTGLFIALCALGYWFYGLFLLVAGAVIWAASLTEEHEATSHGPAWAGLGIAAAVTALLCIYPVLAITLDFSGQPGVTRAMEAWLDHGEIGRGEFGLNMAILHGNWVGWPWLDARGDSSPSSLPILVWIPLLAAGFIGWKKRAAGRAGTGVARWVLLALLGYVLSLGPYLKLGQVETTTLPLPFLMLYDGLPFFDRLWWPDRFSILFFAGTGVLLSLSVDTLREAGWRRSSWIPALVAAGIVLETGTIAGVHPIPAAHPRPVDAALYEGLEGPMLTVPLMGVSDDSRHVLWAQTFHGQPITGGLGDHIEGHRPTEYVEFVESNSLLRLLARLSQGETASAIIHPEDIDALLEQGLIWAVVDHQVFPIGEDDIWGRCFRDVFHTIWGLPERQAPRGAVWRIEPLSSEVVIPVKGPLPLPGTSPYGDQAAPPP